MKPTENLDLVFLVTLLDQLNQISALLEATMPWHRQYAPNLKETPVYEALIRLVRLRVRIEQHVAEMQDAEERSVAK